MFDNITAQKYRIKLVSDCGSPTLPNYFDLENSRNCNTHTAIVEEFRVHKYLLLVNNEK